MKTIPLIVCIFTVFAGTAYGRLGETENQIESRYGRSVKISSGNAKSYEKDGISITVYYGTMEQSLNGESVNGKSVKEVYVATLVTGTANALGVKFSEEALAALFEANKGASEWKEPVASFADSISSLRRETKDRTRESDLYVDNNVERLSVRMVDASRKASGF